MPKMTNRTQKTFWLVGLSNHIYSHIENEVNSSELHGDDRDHVDSTRILQE